MTDRHHKPIIIQRLSAHLNVPVGLSRYSSVEFLIALVAFLVVTPFVEELSQAVLIEGVLLTMVLASAVLAVGADRRTLIVALILSIPAVLSKWIHHFAPDVIPAEAFPAVGIAFVGFVVFHLLRFILNASEVDTEVLCAGIATYLTIGLLWAFAYVLVSRVSSNAYSFSGMPDTHVLTNFEALYFSYVTLTTVGFGDITAVSSVARMLAVLEALTGTIYLAVLVARLLLPPTLRTPPNWLQLLSLIVWKSQTDSRGGSCQRRSRSNHLTTESITMTFRLLIPMAFCLFAMTLPACGADDLIQRIPSGANALMVIDVSSLESSPLAQAQGWAKKHEAAFVERPMMLPPEATRIVLGSQLNFASEMNVEWQVAAMNLVEPLSLRSIARAEGGYLDKIAKADCVWVPSDAYFVSLEPKQLGVVFPANRQLASRWTQDLTSGVLSNYLSTANRQVDKTNQIVMAVDLRDVPQPHRLREHLKSSPATNALSSKLDAIETLVLGIQGVTLRVAVGQSAKGTLRVDFSDSPAVLGAQAKPLVLEALDNFGAKLPGLDQWTAKIELRSIVLEGTFSTDALRRVFSLLELPSTKFSTLKDELPDTPSESSSASPAAKAAASKAYFKGVSVLIEDLRKTLGDTRDNHAVWMERYARKVDALPVLNVDDDLLAWGARVGETFRVMALAERSGGLKSGVRKSSVYGNYQYAYDSNGYTNFRSNQSVKAQIDTEEKAQAKAVRFNNWKEIEDATAAIRKEMTKRYQTEF